MKKLFLKILKYSQKSCRPPTQMLSSEYYESFKNTYFEGHLLTADSDFLKQLQNSSKQLFLYCLFH